MTRLPILVTGAPGGVGSVGFKIVELLRAQGCPVRAFVRQIDERSEALVQLGADVVADNLTDLSGVSRAIEGCSRIYFGMAASPTFLEATLNTAAVARHHGVEAS